MGYSNYDMEESVYQYHRDEARAEAARPKCCKCEEPIWDEYGYEIDDGVICPDCVTEISYYDIMDIMADHKIPIEED